MSLSPSAIVHDDYGNKIPPHPGRGWTRFVCISDTHSKTHYSIPAGDVLIHAGDLSSWGQLSQLEVTINWLTTLPHDAKVHLLHECLCRIIAGNHDVCTCILMNSIPLIWDVNAACALVRSDRVKRAGLHYLEHSVMELVTPQNGRCWKIYGSPAAPRYAPGCFQYESVKHAKEIYDRIPRDTEILLTHTPPHGTQDLSKRGIHAGCPHLSTRLGELDRCQLHVFGHIHEGHGATVHDAMPGTGSISKVSVNAAVAWGGQPVIVDLRND
ncbi:Metallo-dependent phosphatase-like protein [Amylostereum chailletii]|nr:Metallo-dependent phosphatase-like protein [Amylostereum chailletii]